MLRTFNFLTAAIVRSLYSIIAAFDFKIREEFDHVRLSISHYEKIENARLLEAVLFVEDRRFLVHRGIDLRGITRALYRTLFWKRLEGGSTIEQQYVRLVTNCREISLKRKLRECILAAKLSHSFLKSQILNSYLLNYPFVENTKGLVELAKKEGFAIEALTNDQIAHLVARLKYPFISNNHPFYLRRVLIIRFLIETQELLVGSTLSLSLDNPRPRYLIKSSKQTTKESLIISY